MTHSYSIINSVKLSPSNSNTNGANIVLNNQEVHTNRNNQWNVTVNSENTWPFILILDNSWGFHPTLQSIIKFTINASSVTTSQTSYDLLFGFTVDNEEYFSISIPMDNNGEQNEIYPNCDIRNTPIQSFAVGDIGIIPDTDRYCDISGGKCSHWRTIQPKSVQNPKVFELNGFPMTFILQNDPISNTLIVSFKASSFTASFIQKCGFIAFPTDKGMEVYISGAETGHTFVISSFSVEYIISATTKPSPTQTTEHITTQMYTSSLSTVIPTPKPTPSPTVIPTSSTVFKTTLINRLIPSNHPTLNPTLNPSLEPTITSSILTSAKSSITPSIRRAVPSTDNPIISPSLTSITPHPTQLKPSSIVSSKTSSFSTDAMTTISDITPNAAVSEALSFKDVVIPTIFGVVVGVCALFCLIVKAFREYTVKKPVTESVAVSHGPSLSKEEAVAFRGHHYNVSSVEIVHPGLHPTTYAKRNYKPMKRIKIRTQSTEQFIRNDMIMDQDHDKHFYEMALAEDISTSNDIDFSETEDVMMEKPRIHDYSSNTLRSELNANYQDNEEKEHVLLDKKKSPNNHGYYEITNSDFNIAVQSYKKCYDSFGI